MPETPIVPPLVDHLFRHESAKMVSILTRIFGPENLDVAEDVVQDSLIEALEHWQYKGVPDNPSAWLFRVARNKALNMINRRKYKRKYQLEILHLLRSEPGVESTLDHLFSEREIEDDQLRMIFTCCHPAISSDSQIALALKTLCAFSIPEIARAFMTSEENVNKRLVRARQNIRDAKVPFAIPSGTELNDRLSTVLTTIYLLFNEGYSASSGNDIIRYELCEEAMRLVQLIIANDRIPRKETAHALAALIFINTSRFKARIGIDGAILTMEEQDRALWDQRMLGIGLSHLSEATKSDTISAYHILATISAQYSLSPTYEAIDWNSILSLYDSLVLIDQSPIVFLNRAVVVSKALGPTEGLIELDKVSNVPAFKTYHLFYSTQAEFYIQSRDFKNAVVALNKAIDLAPLKPERELLARKRAFCTEKN